VQTDWKFWVLLVCAIGTMTLLWLNRGLADANREQLKAVNERQAFINDTIGISNFSSQFIQSLANLAARTGDESLRQVLADHGVTYSVDDNAQPAAADAVQQAQQPEAQQ